MKEKHTKNCVRCFKPAKSWSGHVLIWKEGKPPEKVFAGWCSRCFRIEGFVGHYLDKMELEETIY